MPSVWVVWWRCQNRVGACAHSSWGCFPQIGGAEARAKFGDGGLGAFPIPWARGQARKPAFCAALFYGQASRYLYYDHRGQAHVVMQGEGGEQGDPLMLDFYDQPALPATRRCSQFRRRSASPRRPPRPFLSGRVIGNSESCHSPL